MPRIVKQHATCTEGFQTWIPACAGMTGKISSVFSRFLQETELCNPHPTAYPAPS